MIDPTSEQATDAQAEQRFARAHGFYRITATVRGLNTQARNLAFRLGHRTTRIAHLLAVMCEDTRTWQIPHNRTVINLLERLGIDPAVLQTVLRRYLRPGRVAPVATTSFGQPWWDAHRGAYQAACAARRPTIDEIDLLLAVLALEHEPVVRALAARGITRVTAAAARRSAARAWKRASPLPVASAAR